MQCFCPIFFVFAKKHGIFHCFLRYFFAVLQHFVAKMWQKQAKV